MGLYWTLQCKRLQFVSYKHSFENGELSLKQRKDMPNFQDRMRGIKRSSSP